MLTFSVCAGLDSGVARFDKEFDVRMGGPTPGVHAASAPDSAWTLRPLLLYEGMAKKRTPPKRQAAKSPADRPKAVARTTAVPSRADFDAVLALIDAARARVVAAVNTTLVDLYWSIGEHISRRIAADGWGKGTVKALAEYIQRRKPNARGFSASNLWRMMQVFETYRDQPKLATLLREVSWSHNLAILSRCKRDEEREFGP
jgi:hypothetical protein